MNFQAVLNNSINDLVYTLHNDFVMQEIVSRLVDKINQANIITKENKYTINKYFSKQGITPLGQSYPQPQFDKKTSVTPKSLLLATLVYLLSNLNIYDEHLVNYAFSIGLRPDSIIVLLLINNIHDIEVFCATYNIGNNGLYNISTLKKLSELHKLQFNYF